MEKSGGPFNQGAGVRGCSSVSACLVLVVLVDPSSKLCEWSKPFCTFVDDVVVESDVFGVVTSVNANGFGVFVVVFNLDTSADVGETDCCCCCC